MTIRFKTFIKEGGNAVEDVVKINQENAKDTLEDIYKNYLPALGLTKKDVAPLGSIGKKGPGQQSGDIDLAISAPAILKSKKMNSMNEILEFIGDLAKKNGHKFKIMKGLGIVSAAFPIHNTDGKQPDSVVQLDFMIVDDVKYASWSYFSPDYLQSELKGLYRNILNFAVAKHAGFKVTKIDPATKTPIEWSRYVMSMGEGLFKGLQTNLSAKTGKPTKSTRYISKEKITNNPDEIVKFLYGSKYKASDILTFEQAFAAIKSNSFPYKSERKKIFKMASEGIQSAGYPIPEVLANEI